MTTIWLPLAAGILIGMFLSEVIIPTVRTLYVYWRISRYRDDDF